MYRWDSHDNFLTLPCKGKRVNLCEKGKFDSCFTANDERFPLISLRYSQKIPVPEEFEFL